MSTLDRLNRSTECHPNVWLGDGFLRSSHEFPDRPALEVQDTVYTYNQLHRRASALARILNDQNSANEPPLTAVLASRSVTAFSGVLSALFRGHGYVPLNPSFPAERTRYMLQQSGCRSLIIDQEGEQCLEELLRGIEKRMVLAFPEHQNAEPMRKRFPGHHILTGRDMEDERPIIPVEVSANDIAYLLFTSGSTGNPKGVMVSHRNIHWFLSVMAERYALNEYDRLSQMFDLVFDLSLFDMFMAWGAGACLCCPQSEQVLLPSDYIRDSAITVWFSVPSVAVLMMRLRQLAPGSFPKLRLSLFCGEALGADVTQAWAKACPNSRVENLYGPTELTVACTLYRWQGEASIDECENGVVPIGEPYPGMTALIVDESLEPVEPGHVGELLMTGPQVALGYWKDPEKTAAAFVKLPDGEDIYYRTGDLVRRANENLPLLYIGRLDNQVKIHGMRIELGEIEAKLREATGAPRAVAIGWPVNENGVAGIVGFLEADLGDQAAIIKTLKQKLPAYMLPKKLYGIPEFPLNSNGKIDRKALIAYLSKN